jgi:hypothetical protein
MTGTYSRSPGKDARKEEGHVPTEDADEGIS